MCCIIRERESGAMLLSTAIQGGPSQVNYIVTLGHIVLVESIAIGLVCLSVREHISTNIDPVYSIFVHKIGSTLRSILLIDDLNLKVNPDFIKQFPVCGFSALPFIRFTQFYDTR